jgi:cell shape-determining protein MreC
MKLGGPIVCCVLAVIAMSLGPTGERRVRSSMRDMSRPGLVLGTWLQARSQSLDMTRWPWTTERSQPPAVAESSSAADEQLLQELRQLRFELAAERQTRADFERSLGPIKTTSQNAKPDVRRIPARVFAADDEASAPGGVILASGTTDGIQAGRIAVQPLRLAVDDGQVLTAHATVLAGAAVVGRTDEVGGWTATVLPVTDPGFRAHVTIVSVASDGYRLGENGVLEGDGQGGCIVKYVPSTASVSAGDHVYSFDPTGRIPQPLYFGQIDRAELRDAAPHWSIHLQPAADPSSLREVHVLVPETAKPSTAANAP